MLQNILFDTADKPTLSYWYTKRVMIH